MEIDARSVPAHDTDLSPMMRLREALARDLALCTLCRILRQDLRRGNPKRRGDIIVDLLQWRGNPPRRYVDFRRRIIRYHHMHTF